MSKVIINLPSAYFQTFKSVVDKEFPEWQVTAFAPLVYVAQNVDQVSVFSIVGVEITPDDHTRLQEIAKRIEQHPPVVNQPAFRFNPIKQPGRYKSKVTVKMGMGKAFKVGR